MQEFSASSETAGDGNGQAATSSVQATEPSAQTTESKQHSLKRSAIKGTAWTTVGFGLAQALRLLSNIVLAAVLEQEAFALMALVNAVIQGLAMFSDIGLSPSIVQNPRGEERDFLNTAWTLGVIRGTGLALIATVGAWPLAAFYSANDPLAVELRYLLPIVALGTFCEGFQSTKLRIAARHMQLGRITIIEFVAQILGLATTVGLAILTRSVYALAFGGLLSMVTHCVLTYVAFPGPRNEFHWDADIAKELVRFGKWIFISTIISFLAGQLDKLILARVFPFEEVGVYSIAANFALLTPLLMGRVQAAIAFPLYSRMLELKISLESIVQRTREPMLAVGGYVVALMMAGAHSFIAFAYDERYAAAGIYIPILAGGAWFAMIEGVYGAALLASGRAYWVAAVNASKVVGLAVLVVPMSHWWGIKGAVAAVALSDVCRMCVATLGARTLGLKSHSRELFFSVFVAAVGLGTMAATRLGPSILHELPLLALCVQFTLVSAMFSPFALRVLRQIRSRPAPATATVEA
jgi:O-antigen/teichoic acid export membrane protein